MAKPSLLAPTTPDAEAAFIAGGRSSPKAAAQAEAAPKGKPKMKPVPLKLEEDLIERIDAAAAKRMLSRTAFLRQAALAQLEEMGM